MRIVSPEEFESPAFAAKWRALRDRCPPCDEGQTKYWNRYWWRYFGHSSSKKLFVLVEEENDVLLALWPLFLRKRFGLRVLSWIGQADGMVTDYTMPLLPEQYREKGIKTFLEFLADNESEWDILDIGIPGWSELMPAFVESAVIHGGRRGLSWDSYVIEHTTSLELGTSFESYVSSLGPNLRRRVRGYLREAEAVGARFDILRGRDCAQLLPQLVRLNQTRWKVFNDRRAREFLSHYIAELPVGEESVFLACLRVDDKVLAAVLGYESKGICYMHSGGVDRNAPGKLNAGTAMWALLFKALMDTGHTRLEWGPGVEEYKLVLGARIDTAYGMTLWHEPSAIERWRFGESLVATKRWAFTSGRRILGSVQRMFRPAAPVAQQA